MRSRDLVRDDWQLSIGAICLEAKCSRNALYDDHPELLAEIRSAIARQRPRMHKSDSNTARSRLEDHLAACRADRQRLISENAALLLGALTAEEALARLKRHAPHPRKVTVLQTALGQVSLQEVHIAMFAKTDSIVKKMSV